MTESYDPETTVFKVNINDESNKEEYYFAGEEDLSMDIGSILADNTLEHELNCNILFVRYNTELIQPFLEFSLFLQNNSYDFMKFNITNSVFDKARDGLKPDDPEFDYDSHFDGLISKTIIDKLGISLEDSKKSIKNIGFFKKEHQLFIFMMTNNTFEIKSEIPHNWSIIDEIMCHQHISNIKIVPDVISLFETNNNFMYIKNNKNNIIDIPILCYNVYLTEIEEKMVRTFQETENDTIEPNIIFHNNYGNRYGFSSILPSEKGDKSYTKYGLFIGDCHYIFNNEDLLVNPSKDIMNDYDEYGIIFISDINNNSNYLVSSISNFTKL